VKSIPLFSQVWEVNLGLIVFSPFRWPGER